MTIIIIKAEVDLSTHTSLNGNKLFIIKMRAHIPVSLQARSHLHVYILHMPVAMYTLYNATFSYVHILLIYTFTLAHYTDDLPTSWQFWTYNY